MKTGLYLGEVPIGKVVVAVAGEGGIQLQTKTVTPSKDKPIEVTPDIGIDGLSKVTVEPIPAVYMDTTTTNAPGPGDMLNNTIAFANGKEIKGELESKDELELGFSELSFNPENKNLIVKGTNPSRAIIQPRAVASVAVEGANLGDATAENVLSEKTFTSENGLAQLGTMPDNGNIGEITLDANTTSYTIPLGRHSGEGKVKIVSDTTKNKAEPSTEQKDYAPDSGKVFTKFTVEKIPDEYVKPSKTLTEDQEWKPSTGDQTIIEAGTYCKVNQTLKAMPSAGTLNKPIATSVTINSDGSVKVGTSYIPKTGYNSITTTQTNTTTLDNVVTVETWTLTDINGNTSSLKVVKS